LQKCGKKKDPFLRLNISKANLLKMFAYNEFKCRIINERIGEEGSTVYKCGDLIDLCRGPHVRNTGKIKAMHMYRNSSAYFEGDAEAEVVQRVYGISFDDTKKLKEWKHIQEEAAKRNHRKIGVEQELFFFHDLSPGSCFFLPKGAFIYRQLLELMREQYKIRGFNEVITPNIFNSKLWETSGHWEHYKDDMFSFETEGETWALKPMNCPSHCVMFKHRTRSHKELPLRLADFGVLHRNESSGSLSGLTRVRRFQQDDAHIFVTPEMIEAEMAKCLDFLQYTYGQFDFTFELELSTRPEKYLGEVAVWDKAEKQLENSLNAFGHPWKLNPADGAFYGPKIDITVRDALKRKFQCATIQLDFQLPIRFGLEYTPAVKNADGSPSRPVIIHRAILGSAERFIGILTEHYAGKFPFWLSPQQAVVVPVVPQFNKYAVEVAQAMKADGFMVDASVDDSLKLGKKVAMALKAGYVFILVVGGEEEKNRAVSVRPFDGTQEESPRSLKEVMAHFQALASERRKDHSFGVPGAAGGKAAAMDAAAVGEWLVVNELGKYQALFAENQIDGHDLADLSHEDLISMGVRSCHDRKEILRCAAEL
jgi:threonyl-tRNA synthetase